MTEKILKDVTILKAEPDEKCNAILKPLADRHVPVGSSTEAVIDQWMHAIATGSELYLDREIAHPLFLESQVIDSLKVANIYKSRKQFYDMLFGNIALKPPFQPRFSFIDLFAGIGGIRIAAQENGGSCAFSSESDPFAQSSYKLNYGEIPFGDITKISEGNVPAHDLLLAGFPCQPFSYSGRCEGFEDKTRGTLFFDILKILEARKPKVAILENVKGFKSHRKGETMDIALKALKEAGYFTRWTILNSYDFGVPQYRERWYCVATRNDVDFRFPESEGRTAKLRDIVDLKDSDRTLALTEFELERISYHRKHEKEQIRVKHDNSKYAPHTKKGKHGVFSFTKPDGSIRFHVGDFAKTQIQEAFYACLNTYAPTIIANRVPKLWDIKRKLSVKESLRLQGFPDTFRFDVSKGQAYKQLGNSVTVPVLSKIINILVREQIL